MGNGWVAASDWVVREGGDIKLRVESENEAAISSRTFQAREQLVLKFVSSSVEETIKNFQI